MNRRVELGVFGLWLVTGGLARAADLGTAFTYQGNLVRGGTPVTDTCDFRFGLWRDAASVAPADQVGTTQLVTSIVITTGVFITEIDYGAGAIDGQARWLELEVQCPGDAAFVLLSPRIRLAPTPHALALPGMRTPETANTPNVIGGTPLNMAAVGVRGATIAGGGFYGLETDEKGTFLREYQNKVFDDFGTIGGGSRNVAGFDNGTVVNEEHATVAGGENNSATGNRAAIGGGYGNVASGFLATIGGGVSNVASTDDAVVGGGRGNTASGGGASTVGGGTSNVASGIQAVVAGGWNNLSLALGSTVAGGRNNVANGLYSAVPGGEGNQAGGDYSFAGGRHAKARDPATTGDADGDQGAFVWADSTGIDFQSTGPNQFLIRAAGGVGIGTNSPDSALDVSFSGFNGISINGNDTGDARIRITNGAATHYIFDDDDGGHALKIESGTGRDVVINTNGAFERMRITSAGQVGVARSNPSFPFHVGTNSTNGNGAHVTNGGTWVNGSDRNSKQAFQDIDKQEVLRGVADLPITRWQYKGEADSVHHIGPVAQDFHAAFGLGHDERYITTIDADGVALAAIQGLYEVVKEKECEIEELRAQKRLDMERLEAEKAQLRQITADLAARNNQLEARLARVEALLEASPSTKGIEP